MPPSQFVTYFDEWKETSLRPLQSLQSGLLGTVRMHIFPCNDALVDLSKHSFLLVGIPGDGRCLFRSVVHGAYLNAGRPTPGESLQRQLADELRARVADEFIKRRVDSEWFLEGDFDMYVGQMRRPHRWGGEPELLMSSHVLQMPISVYMRENKCGGLRIIAEYGQEYDKGKTIRVLYHSCGHYDALRGDL